MAAAEKEEEECAYGLTLSSSSSNDDDDYQSPMKKKRVEPDASSVREGDKHDLDLRKHVFDVTYSERTDAYLERKYKCVSRYPKFAKRDRRRASFGLSFPYELNKFIPDLVKYGFFYKGYSDVCSCWVCGLTLNVWDQGEDVAMEHVKFSPYCDYMIEMKGEEFMNKVRLQIPSFRRYTVTTINEVTNYVDLLSDVQARLELKRAEWRKLCKFCLQKEANMLHMGCLHMVYIYI